MCFKTKIKGDTKRTIEMWCQIFHKKSEAPSSSDFCRQSDILKKRKTKIFEKNKTKKKHLVNFFLDSLSTWWRSVAQGSLKEFSISFPQCVETGEVYWVYLIKYYALFFVLPIILMRPIGNWVHEIDAPGPNLSLGTFRNIMISILEFCRFKPFMSGQKPYSII